LAAPINDQLATGRRFHLVWPQEVCREAFGLLDKLGGEVVRGEAGQQDGLLRIN